MQLFRRVVDTQVEGVNTSIPWRSQALIDQTSPATRSYLKKKHPMASSSVQQGPPGRPTTLRPKQRRKACRTQRCGCSLSLILTKFPGPQLLNTQPARSDICSANGRMA
eukprot:196921-Amphidinium_carterae.1